MRGARIGIAGALLVALAVPAEPCQAGDPAVRRTSAAPAHGGLPELNWVQPGTIVDAKAPNGWTQLVLKSIPRLASGDLDTIPESSRPTATMFHNLILADVAPGPGGWTLKRIGIGVCVPHNGHDVVVRSNSLDQLGIDLGTIPRIVLDRTEKEMAKGRLFARTPTFAMFRSPVTMLIGGAHRDVYLNYAFLVDPRTGKLSTAVWWLDARQEAWQPAQELVLMKPAPLIEKCDVDVSAGRLFGGIPVSWSFAVKSLPPGRTLPVPGVLRPWTVRDPQTAAEAANFERAVRDALKPAG